MCVCGWVGGASWVGGGSYKRVGTQEIKDRQASLGPLSSLGADQIRSRKALGDFSDLIFQGIYIYIYMGQSCLFGVSKGNEKETIIWRGPLKKDTPYIYLYIYIYICSLMVCLLERKGPHNACGL